MESGGRKKKKKNPVSPDITDGLHLGEQRGVRRQERRGKLRFDYVSMVFLRGDGLAAGEHCPRVELLSGKLRH